MTRAALLHHAYRCVACGGHSLDHLARLETAPRTALAVHVLTRHHRRVWLPVL